MKVLGQEISQCSRERGPWLPINQEVLLGRQSLPSTAVTGVAVTTGIKQDEGLSQKV